MNLGSESDSGEFERRTRALLLGSADDLPGAVRSRLTQARHAALAARPSRLSYLRAGHWIPAGAAVAALALVMVFVGPLHSGSTVNSLSNVALEDLGLLTDSDAVTLNGDQDVDYDFYEWAAGEAATGPTASSVGT
jgi:hypothetical protein